VNEVWVGGHEVVLGEKAFECVVVVGVNNFAEYFGMLVYSAVEEWTFNDGG